MTKLMVFIILGSPTTLFVIFVCLYDVFEKPVYNFHPQNDGWPE